MAPTTIPSLGGKEVVSGEVVAEGDTDSAFRDHSVARWAIFSKRVCSCFRVRARRSLDPGLEVLQRMNAPLLEYFPAIFRKHEHN